MHPINYRTPLWFLAYLNIVMWFQPVVVIFGNLVGRMCRTEFVTFASAFAHQSQFFCVLVNFLFTFVILDNNVLALIVINLVTSLIRVLINVVLIAIKLVIGRLPVLALSCVTFVNLLITKQMFVLSPACVNLRAIHRLVRMWFLLLILCVTTIL